MPQNASVDFVFTSVFMAMTSPKDMQYYILFVIFTIVIMMNILNVKNLEVRERYDISMSSHEVNLVPQSAFK